MSRPSATALSAALSTAGFIAVEFKGFVGVETSVMTRSFSAAFVGILSGKLKSCCRRVLSNFANAIAEIFCGALEAARAQSLSFRRMGRLGHCGGCDLLDGLQSLNRGLVDAFFDCGAGPANHARLDVGAWQRTGDQRANYNAQTADEKRVLLNYLL